MIKYGFVTIEDVKLIRFCPKYIFAELIDIPFDYRTSW